MSKPKKKRTWEWCSQKEVEVTNINNTGIIGKKRSDIYVSGKVTCPLCKHRFQPRIKECNDQGCWHVYVPPHKYLK